MPKFSLNLGGTLHMSELVTFTRNQLHRKFISIRVKQMSKKLTPLFSADFALMLSKVSKMQKILMKMTATR